MPRLTDKLRMISAEQKVQHDAVKKSASQDCYRISERYPITSFPTRGT